MHEIRICESARTSPETYRGQVVSAAFYTCGYRDGSAERELGPINHAQTYIFDGQHVGVEAPLMIRTGNWLGCLPPRALRVCSVRNEGRFFVYDVEDLPPVVEDGVLKQLGVMQGYERRINSDTDVDSMALLFDHVKDLKKLLDIAKGLK